MPVARGSTGGRLEPAALDAAREATGGRNAGAAQRLVELELMLEVAAELGDLPLPERSTLDAAVSVARTTLRAS